MSELIQMRYRMKAVKTIQKITRAMCLVSMAKHTRLRAQKIFLENYSDKLSTLFATLSRHAPSWHHPLLQPTSDSNKNLAILITSQKGLCGTFNSTLLHFFARQAASYKSSQLDIITIGQRLDNVHYQHLGNIIKEFNTLSTEIMPRVAQECTNIIFNNHQPYSKVTVFYNQSKKFFIQKPHAEQLIPFVFPSIAHSSSEDFIWEQSPHDLLNAVAYQLVQVQLFRCIFESLLAEQAARFIAMDAATRNANNLLVNMRLTYNKIRQAKITRELTDLIGSFF